MSKEKSKVLGNMFKTNCLELDRQAKKVNDAIEGKNIRTLSNLKQNLNKAANKVEESYLKYMQTDEFDQDVEYPNFANSKDLAEDSILKIEECLFSLESKNESKINQDESKDKDKESKQCENIKLPKYNLIKFNGEIDSWLYFRDIFETTIDRNKSLTPVEKLQYLASSLTDQPAKLIKGFPITNDSYQPAWQTLCDRYECKREIAFSQINKLLSIKSMKSAKSIREVLDSCNESIRNLKTLGYETNSLVELIIIQNYQSKLDAVVRQQWEFSLEKKSVPNLNQFINFLEKQARSTQDIKESIQKSENKIVPKKSSVLLVKNQAVKCILCSQSHLLFKCPEFNKMTLDQRWSTVKSYKICSNCLRSGHFANKCLINSKCKACGRNHHSMLHAFKPESNQTPQYTPNPQIYTNSANSIEGVASNSQCFSNHINENENILLSTALIKVRNSQGNYVKCRALIDSASQTSLVTKECCSRLNLPMTTTNHSITGINDTIAETTVYKTKLEFVPHFSNDLFTVSALVVNKVTTNLPNFVVPSVKWEHIKNIILADPFYYKQEAIDILIGADLYAELILGQPIIGEPGSPTALKSKLGWLLSGKVANKSNNSKKLLSHHTLLNLDEQLARFWEIEAIPLMPFEEKDEDHTCELIYRSTTTRDKSGRFTVNLPFKNGPSLGESKGQAIRRFLSVEKRLNENPELKAQYIEFMKEYHELGHMLPTNVNEFSESSQHYYLPHHGVLRPQSETTKLRVVFDGSALTTSGISLNDILLTGPKIQQDLFNILLRFRTHLVAFSADLEKMFRQILIKPSHTNFQRIIWRDSPEKPLEEFNLATVTYGTSSAPFLAIRTVQQLAEEEKLKFPLASEIAKRDFYVDDLLTGADSVDAASLLIKQLNQLMESGGFNLRKWSCSHEEVLKNLPSENKLNNKTVHIDDHKNVNLLGLHWNPKRDTFQIQISEPDIVMTKRQLLSAISKIFDPLGLLSPTTIVLKIMMQQLWKNSLSWDDPMPPDIIKTWTKFSAQFAVLKTLQFPRYLAISSSVASFELHGFCDASSKAYAAVFYSRVTLKSGEIVVRLVASKTRVAPIKNLTLPRLELCSCLLLARLFKAVALSINNFDKVYFWSDSEISLCWIRLNSAKDLFVKNRVAIINDLTDKLSWFHVASKQNPADCATRGLMPDKLEKHSLWFEGPPFLFEPVVRTEFNVHTVIDIQTTKEISNELKLESQQCQVFSQTEEDGAKSFIQSYSSFNKLRRTTAWCLRFISNCRTESSNRIVGFLCSEELQKATLRLVQIVQRSEFKKEIEYLQKKKPLPNENKCLSLNLFLDPQGLLRIGGRLNNTRLKWDTIHQLLLPKNHHFTQLIINHFHEKYLHGGSELVLNMLRHQFWIPSGRSQVKKVLNNCITCFRFRAKPNYPIMGQLPAARVNPSRPFQFTGVDLAGPFITKPNVKRSRIKIKSYVALFVCFTTKAIHLEAVSDLTTSCFIASLLRFISRRGKPSEIYSDNATNFRGSRNCLREMYQIYKSEKIQKLIADEEIKWRFIPPRSPHMGGLWESNIKSMKSHLIKTCKAKVLNFEELITLLAQIEACLNSRPLTPLSSDPNDLDVLTPGHFLVGPAQQFLPELTNTSVPALLENWKSIQSLRDQFWTRWSKEYLLSLQQRPKWKKSQPDIRVGDLVLVSDNNPKMNWPLARVTQTFPGDDGVTRVVEVKMQNGTFKRSIHKLCPLPTACSPSGGGGC